MVSLFKTFIASKFIANKFCYISRKTCEKLNYKYKKLIHTDLISRISILIFQSVKLIVKRLKNDLQKPLTNVRKILVAIAALRKTLDHIVDYQSCDIIKRKKYNRIVPKCSIYAEINHPGIQSKWRRLACWSFRCVDVIGRFSQLIRLRTSN